MVYSIAISCCISIIHCLNPYLNHFSKPQLGWFITMKIPDHRLMAAMAAKFAAASSTARPPCTAHCVTYVAPT